MNTVKQLRSDILELLFKVKNIETLKTMSHELEVIYKHSESNDPEFKSKPAFLEGIRPIKENVTLQELMEEQSYKPCTYEDFREVANQVDWGGVTLEAMLEAIK